MKSGAGSAAAWGAVASDLALFPLQKQSPHPHILRILPEIPDFLEHLREQGKGGCACTLRTSHPCEWLEITGASGKHALEQGQHFISRAEVPGMPSGDSLMDHF